MLSVSCIVLVVEYKIDAAHQILGRLASKIALLLRGKNDPHFDPSCPSNNKVIILNIDKLRFSGKKKLTQKLYRRHSGFPGGLKEKRLADVMAKDSRLALRWAVRGMLPKNKLRQIFMKNLILFREGER